MRASVFFLFMILAIGKCVEEVPRASAIRSAGYTEVRRAPVYKPQNTAPRAHGFKRISTGVRRSPHVPASPPKRNRKPMREPLSVQAISLPTIAPMSFPLVTFPPLPSFPTLATIAMPTLPGFTMPPSFQRLMGITTPSPTMDYTEKNRRSERERPRRPSRKMDGGKESRPKKLSPVSSRLPKFVNSRDMVVVKAEENADWIVPF